MRSIGALLAARFDQPLRAAHVQQAIERSQLLLSGQQAIAEFAQHREMKAGVGQLQREGVFPINRPAHGIGSLAVGQAFQKLEDGDQQQAAG